MQKAKNIEIMVGLFVAAGFAALFMLAMKVSNLSAFSENDTYTVQAQFDNIGGLKVRSPVRIGGVRIGRVSSIRYDDNKLEAVVHMIISNKHNKLPEDTRANIYTAGLLGEQYIGLEPGGSTEFLKNGDRIVETQSALVLERLIGHFLVNPPAEAAK